MTANKQPPASSRLLKKEKNEADKGTVSKKRRVSAHHGRPSEVPSEVPRIKEAGDRSGKKQTTRKRPLVTFKLFLSWEELMEEQCKMMEEYNISKQC